MLSILTQGFLLPLLVIFSLMIVGCENDNPVSTIENAEYADGVIYEKTDGDNNGSTGKMNYSGYTYRVVRIGSQWWMAENLRTKKFNDGSNINFMPSREKWSTYQTAWCYYNNDYELSQIYGYLYNRMVVGPRVAPPGWRVSSEEDWREMELFLGMPQSQLDNDPWNIKPVENLGGKLKEIGFLYWDSPNTGATNETGFTALPSGYRRSDGEFGGLGTVSVYWTTSFPPFGTRAAIYYNATVSLSNKSASIFHGAGYYSEGLAIRCVKN